MSPYGRETSGRGRQRAGFPGRESFHLLFVCVPRAPKPEDKKQLKEIAGSGKKRCFEGEWLGFQTEPELRREENSLRKYRPTAVAIPGVYFSIKIALC